MATLVALWRFGPENPEVWLPWNLEAVQPSGNTTGRTYLRSNGNGMKSKAEHRFAGNNEYHGDANAGADR